MDFTRIENWIATFPFPTPTFCLQKVPEIFRIKNVNFNFIKKKSKRRFYFNIWTFSKEILMKEFYVRRKNWHFSHVRNSLAHIWQHHIFTSDFLTCSYFSCTYHLQSDSEKIISLVELITSANANVYQNIVSFCCILADGFGETEHSHKLAHQDNINLSRGKAGEGIRPPKRPLHGLVVLVRYWLAVLKQVLVINRSNIFSFYIFFSWYALLVK